MKATIDNIRIVIVIPTKAMPTVIPTVRPAPVTVGIYKNEETT